MPHILVIALGAVTFYFAFRWLRREYERVETSLRRAERKISRRTPSEATLLTLDVTTGVYRPAE